MEPTIIIARANPGILKSGAARHNCQKTEKSNTGAPFLRLHKTVMMIVTITASIFVNCTGARAEPFLGQIMITGNSFCPRGWAEANGQLVAISSNEALFSLYGTTYGGDGRTTFGLPDLRGRVPIHQGRGPGLSPRELGSAAGSDVVNTARGDTETNAGPPSLTLRYCIAFQGVFPSRN